MKIHTAAIYQYTLPLECPIPLRQGPLTTRDGLLLRLEDPSGHFAWGEAAPLPGFSREDLAQCRRTLIDAATALVDRDDSPDDGALAELSAFRSNGAHSAAYFAVESAWRNLVALTQDAMPWSRHRSPGQDTLHLNALLAGDVDDIASQAQRAKAEGFRAVKLKVGRERMADDLRLVEMVRDLIGPDTALRLDANQAWSLEDAVLFGKAARKFNIAYIEEPCQAPFDLPSFHATTGVDYAVDESIQSLHDLVQRKAARPGEGVFRDLPVVPVVQGAKAIIWKPTLVHTPDLGQLLFEEIDAGQARSLVLSASFETGVGIAALAGYAARFATPDTPVGLDTYRWITPDVLKERLPMAGGSIHLPAIFAAGQQVDTDRLTKVWPL